jgi:hypothetical protein
MPVVSLRYHFRQNFRANARAAFVWCTDFGPGDAAFFSSPGSRSVERLTEDALLMTDRRQQAGGRREITRLVRIDRPSMAWTNTHVSGPFLHSQFWYRVVPDGPRRSHLEFDGLELRKLARRPSARELARLTEETRAGDARLWRERIGPALDRDLAGRARGRTKGRT